MEKVPHVLVVSLPAQGHVMPLMEFSHQLVEYGVKVTFVNAEFIHQKLVFTLLDHKEDQKDRRIHLVSFSDELDLNDDRTDSQKYVDFMSRDMEVHLEKLIKKINESGNEKIDCVVADPNLGWGLEFTEKLGIKRAAFWPASLGFLAFMLHVPKLVEAGDIDDKGYPLKEEVIRLPHSMPAMSNTDLLCSDGRSDDNTIREMLLQYIQNVNKGAKVANWILCNSFRELEPASCDFIPNILSIGPLLASEQLGHPTGHLLPEDSTCITWLDQQPVQSVVYFAFGSTTTFNQSQFNELVHGLELVNRPFLWVVRPGLTDELSPLNSDSFKDTIAYHGKIVSWAPQRKVLAHPSIACFVTHCGWNSTVDGVSMGVPLLCWPYLADQFHNRNYICDIWKVGLRLDKDENGIITRSEIKTKVQKLLGDEGIRSRANNFKDMGKRSVSEGGLSSNNFKDFINWIKF
ncbi:hypothetical protein IFM89_004583 [Coptis chinensis]|uniref:Glycosyltransferase n=1 Tax=Coptis chinensis TaxID=261450 RepID=A0A835H3H6_9MAGN|nr:hypothetical protein IFM89_004583 [Coptis chinensis]